MTFNHQSVLLNETIESLNIQPEGIYVDGTLGGGGHASEVCRRLTGKGRLIGIDQDGAAIEAAGKRLEPYKDRVTIVRSNYADMKRILEDLGIAQVNGILLDLGVSSYQLDTEERGFTYRADVALDMRMDQSQKLTAKDVVNTYSQAELERILKDYGGERHARAIAESIVSMRQIRPFETTMDLVNAVRRALPARVLHKPGHPAKQTFMAIRFEVNNEREEMEVAIRQAIEFLRPGGRCAVITFNSDDDAQVKHLFESFCPRAEVSRFLPPTPDARSDYRIVTRKPIVPSRQELEFNPRSEPAKLRVIERR